MVSAHSKVNDKLEWFLCLGKIEICASRWLFHNPDDFAPGKNRTQHVRLRRSQEVPGAAHGIFHLGETHSVT